MLQLPSFRAYNIAPHSRYSTAAIERLKKPDRGGQNLSQRYRRLEQSLRGKQALQRDKRELEESRSSIVQDNTKSSSPLDASRFFCGFEVPQRPRAPESDECCMSGCAVCVYDLYEESMAGYRTAVDTFRAKLVAMGIPTTDWPGDLSVSTATGTETNTGAHGGARGVTLSAFEALEKALEEKRRLSRTEQVLSLRRTKIKFDDLCEGLRWLAFSRR